MLEEKVIGSVSPTDQAINWRWHPPKDTPPETRRQLIEEERRAAIVDRWPKLPQPALHGKTAVEAAGDPELRIPLLANLLILEQGGNSDRDVDSIAELRRDLNLPQPDAIVPDGQSISGLPLVRVSRLKIENVSDDDLVMLYRRSILVGAHAATLRLAREAVARPSLADRIPPADAYQRMIAAERDPDKALVLINAAREQSKVGRPIDGDLGPGRVGIAHHDRKRRRGQGFAGPHRARTSRRSAGCRGAVSVAVRNGRDQRRANGPCPRSHMRTSRLPAAASAPRAGSRPNLDAGQRSANRRQIGPVDAILRTSWQESYT